MFRSKNFHPAIFRARRASTIFETVIYVGLLVIILATMMTYLVNLLRRQAKIETVAEVARNASFALDKATTTVRNAREIILPEDEQSGSVLSLTMADAGLTPTVFEVIGGVLTMKQGAGPAVPLTSARVSVQGFTVRNLISESTHLRTEPEVVICQTNQNKRLICHNGNTQCVNKNAKLAEGDMLGPCYSVTTAKPSLEIQITVSSSADADATNEFMSTQTLYATASIPRQN